MCCYRISELSELVQQEIDTKGSFQGMFFNHFKRRIKTRHFWPRLCTHLKESMPLYTYTNTYHMSCMVFREFLKKPDQPQNLIWFLYLTTGIILFGVLVHRSFPKAVWKFSKNSSKSEKLGFPYSEMQKFNNWVPLPRIAAPQQYVSNIKSS